ncbi:MAG: Hsp20/alpha crystallin family protein, partial [bacterium]
IDEDEQLEEAEDFDFTSTKKPVASGGKKSMQIHPQFDDKNRSSWMDDSSAESELSVDVYQTQDDVIVKAMIPGVKKEDLEINLTRDSVTLKGIRKEEKIVSDDDYFHRELYWGSFSRTIQLPHEVDIEHAEAIESQGILTLKLPRVDKDRQMKIRIKSL